MKITIKNHQKKIPIFPRRIKRAILKALSCKRSCFLPEEITVCFVDDTTIKNLNARFLKTNQPTDVLAFNLGKDRISKVRSAEVAISTDAVLRNAATFKTSFTYELYLYVIHGILHILGYRDNTKKQREFMQKKCKKLLSTIKTN